MQYELGEPASAVCIRSVSQQGNWASTSGLVSARTRVSDARLVYFCKMLAGCICAGKRSLSLSLSLSLSQVKSCWEIRGPTWSRRP